HNTHSTEQSRLTPIRVWTKQVNHPDTCVKHLRGSGQHFELRCWSVDWILPFTFRSLNTLNRLANHIKHSSFNIFSNRHRNGGSRINNFGLPNQSVGRIHCNSADTVFA